jgi:hypothetical protein
MAPQASVAPLMCGASLPLEIRLAPTQMGLHPFIGVAGELEAAAQMV